jgi:Ca-activated chloride channel family protein
METTALTFAHPMWLSLLWLLPLGVLLFWWAEQRRRALLGKIVAPKLRELLAGSASPARRWFRQGCMLASLGLLGVALAGPRLGYDTLEVPHRGRDVIIAMDVSRSMLAADVAPTRLQRAKLFVEDLVTELGGDRLGLVAFAGSSFLQAPLTLDHGAVLAAVDELDTNLIPLGGSNMAAAIGTAEEAFGKAEGFSRALIIVSDGEELDADGVAAARQAAASGIRIFTVGIGSEEGAEIALGPGEFVRDDAGKVVQSKLDATRLREIADVTGGFYAPLDAGTVQKLVTNGIGQLEEKEMTASASRRPIERYQWPLGAAVALLILQALVGERRRRPVAVAAAMLWVTLAPTWSAPADAAKSDLEAVRKKFEDRLRMEPAAANLQFNAGTAAYRMGDYDKAAEYFSRAMLSDDPQLRSAAEYNLANTLFRAGEKKQNNEQKIADWKEAIAKYETAMKTRPDYTEAKENKERVEELLRQLEQEQKQKEQKQDQQQKDQQKQDQQQPDKGDQEQQEQPKDGDKKDEPSADGGQKDEPQSGDSQDKKEGEQGQEPKNEGQGGQDQKEQGQQGDQPKDQGKPEQPDGDQDSGGEGDRDKQEKKSGEGDQKGEEQKPEPGQDGRPSPSRPEPGQDGNQPAPVPQQSGDKKEGELRGGDAAGPTGNQGEPAPAAAEEEVEGRMSESQARALLRALQGEEEQVDLRERSPFQEVLRDW